MSKRHIFLSYCRENKAAVAELRADLIDAGEAVWWDHDILPGQDWKKEIREALRASYAVLLCLSKEVGRRHTSGLFPEALDAINLLRLHPPGSIFLVPVRLSACDLPELELDSTRTLASLQYVDLFPPAQRAEALAHLITALRMSPDHPRHLRDAPLPSPFVARTNPDILAHLDRLAAYAERELRSGVFGLFHAETIRRPGVKLSTGPLTSASMLPEAYRPQLSVIFTADGSDSTEFADLATAVSSLAPPLVVAGPAGCGKTTALLDYAHSLANSARSGEEALVPILAPLHTWRHGEPIHEWLHRVTAIPQGLLDSDSIGAVLILDGLDELPSDIERKEFMALVEQTHVPWIISCRDAELATLRDSETAGISEARVLSLARLTPDQVTEYVRGIPALKEMLAADSALSSLAQTPLFLALLAAAVAADGGRAPDARRSMRYRGPDSIVKYYVQGRFNFEARRHAGRVRALESIYRGLGPIATALVNRASERTSFSLAEFSEAAENPVSAPLQTGNAPMTAQEVLDCALLLDLLVQGADGRLRFKHLILRDHFAMHDAVRTLRFDNPKALRPDDPFVLAMSIQSLCQIGGADALHYVIRFIDEDFHVARKSEFVLQSAIMGLGRSADLRALQSLADRIPELIHMSPMVTVNLQRAMVTLGRQYPQKVLELLAQPNKAVKDFIGSVARSIVTIKQIPLLVSYLQHSNRDVRWWSVQLLSSLKAEVESWILPLVAHAEPHVRAAAVEVLGRIGSRRAVGDVLGTLSDPLEELRAAAVTALGRIGSQEAVSGLSTMVSDASDIVRAALAASVSTCSESGISELIGRLSGDRSDLVRIALARALGETASALGAEILAAYLEDGKSSEQLVKAAAIAAGKRANISKRGSPLVSSALLTAFRRHGDSPAGYEVCLALEGFGNAPPQCESIIAKHKVATDYS